MITQRAWLVGVVGFCFYLIAVVNTLPAFYQALTWLSFGVLASSLGIAFLSLIGLRAAWRVPQAIVMESIGQAEGGPVVEVQISNVGTLNKTGVLIEVHLERISGNISADKENAAKTRHVRRFLMEALPSGNSLQTALPLPQLPRGRYRVVELKFIGSDVLGLFRTQKRVAPGVSFESVMETGKGSTPSSDKGGAKEEHNSGQTELIVGPAALTRHEIALSPLQLARGDGGVPATRFLGQGEDVRGTRLYATGDDLRHVHWKSTARKGQLVVKEFHHTVQEQVLVVWDGEGGTRAGQTPVEEMRAAERIRENGAATSGFNSQEWGLRLTASLCRAFLESRRPCALLRLDAAPISAGLGSDSQPSAMQQSGLSMDQVSEVLADTSANRTQTLGAALQPFRARRQAGEVYLVTASLSPELARAVHLWRAEGARVAVALINGAAFLDAASTANLGEAGGRQSTPFANAGAAQSAPFLEITTEKYQQQARALRAAGAHVALVAPRENSRDFVLPIHAVLQELLDKSPSGERPQTGGNRSLQNQTTEIGAPLQERALSTSPTGSLSS